MVTFWSTASNAMAIAIFPKLWFDKAANKAFLEFDRTNYGDDKNVRYRLVADAAGPVVNAFLQLDPANQVCELLDNGLNEGKYAFGVLSELFSGGMANEEGVIAGDIGATYPSLVIKQKANPNLNSGWAVSSSLLAAYQVQIRARPWDSDTWSTAYDPAQDPEHMPEIGARPFGSSIFWEVEAGGYNGVMSWTLADGARPLLRWYGDYTQAAGNFNTDGNDMVWTYGSGKKTPDGEYTFPVMSIMTAPFTTDPATVKVVQKRLRSDPGPLTPYPYAVGCGYAARQISIVGTSDASAGSNDLLIVRLSDGVSWIVSAPPIEQKMGFNQAIGVTCDEVFATAVFPDELNTIVRIRLDSLGPGIPPD